jgi:glutaredoxin
MGWACWRWLGRRRKVVCESVVMYHREGCHLCEEAWHLLNKAQKRYGFTLEAVDVDEDPALRAAYGDQVPVVTFDGNVRFRGVVNAALLRRLFEYR